MTINNTPSPAPSSPDFDPAVAVTAADLTELIEEIDGAAGVGWAEDDGLVLVSGGAGTRRFYTRQDAYFWVEETYGRPGDEGFWLQDWRGVTVSIPVELREAPEVELGGQDLAEYLEEAAGTFMASYDELTIEQMNNLAYNAALILFSTYYRIQ